MQKIKLKTLLQTLSFEDQKKILMVWYEWCIHQELVEVKKGLSPMPSGGVDEIRNIDPEFENRIDEAIANGDKNKSFKIGLADIFRGMRIIQKERTGPQLNAFFKRNLPEKLFFQWYEAVGLDINSLVFDFEFSDFPVDDL
ncbi:MAG: hypothetical protein JKY93_03755 [Gammaproteobacteria bacterium]|nr:hypothetical protein [Gammaproteobacteria bacterium]